MTSRSSTDTCKKKELRQQIITRSSTTLPHFGQPTSTWRDPTKRFAHTRSRVSTRDLPTRFQLSTTQDVSHLTKQIATELLELPMLSTPLHRAAPCETLHRNALFHLYPLATLAALLQAALTTLHVTNSCSSRSLSMHHRELPDSMKTRTRRRSLTVPMFMKILTNAPSDDQIPELSQELSVSVLQ